jgi:hypothetical protein
MKVFEGWVDRIVKPLRASNRRKRTMREELLAHLSLAYEDARKMRLNDDEAARRALEELGDLAELRSNLQASVPRAERVGMIPLVRRGKGESDLHFATRLTAYAGAFLLVVMAIAVGLCGIVTGFAKALDANWGAVAFAYAMAFVVIWTTFLADIHVYRYVRNGRVGKALITSAGSCVFLGVLLIGGCLVLPALEPWLASLVPMAIRGVLLGLVVFEVAWMADSFRLRNSPWLDAQEEDTADT